MYGVGMGRVLWGTDMGRYGAQIRDTMGGRYGALCISMAAMALYGRYGALCISMAAMAFYGRYGALCVSMAAMALCGRYGALCLYDRYGVLWLLWGAVSV